LHPTRARPRAGSDPDQIRIRDLDPKGSIQENAVGADIREDANSSPAPVSVMAFPASGKTPAWYLTEAWLAEAVAAFPGLDVPADLRIALAKVNTGAVRKPTARGMSRFLMGWLSRSNDRRPPAPTTAPPDLRCVWHRDPKNDVRASAYPKPGCPRCKHFAARDRKRQGEPTELGELMAQKAAEVEAAAERERLAGRERWARDQAPADPPKRTEKTGTGG
jgi:hypothetical protein